MRNGIKSIKVSLRPVHLTVGDVVYDGVKGCMRKIVVKSEPYSKYPHETDIRRAVWVCDVDQTYLPAGNKMDKHLGRGTMRVSQIYLGDDGVEGYQYDDRPSGIGRTEEGAHLRYQFYSKWLTQHKAKNNDYTTFGFNF